MKYEDVSKILISILLPISHATTDVFKMTKLASSISLTLVFEKLLAFNTSKARAQLIAVICKIARYYKNPISFRKEVSSMPRTLPSHF